ncbi:MAG: ABC transporter substrate-binding protein [Candidatus Limnocylindrales bacterium]|jgi:peptide/nickel transport system substrate-binding protein
MQIGKSRLLALLAVASIVASACSSTAATPTAAAPGTQAPATVAPATPATTPAGSVAPTPNIDTTVYPRAQTLYTTGKQWGAPSTWNPLDPNTAMGVVGLQYETLFLYDTFKDTYIPWLALSGSWDSAKTTYTIKTRTGVKWSDGQDFTAADVAFTIGLAKIKALGSNLWTMVSDATATDATTVVVKFSKPAYQEWQQWLYNSPIVPQHIWSTKADENILKITNENGVGTGAYTYKTHADDRTVWVKNPNWWATAALNLAVAPTYIVDLVNGSNNVGLAHVMQGDIDLSNNFVPGLPSLLLNYSNITTYYPKAPYMLSGNTAVLVPNTQKKPLDDPAFRKALATSINTDDIINKVYSNLVKASDPTGLLPNFSKYIDTNVTKSLGFSFSTAKAKSMLAAAGYKAGSDGMVTNKDGSALKLTLEVPTGWSDWEQAEKSIAASAKLAGINIDPQNPDQPTNVADRNRPDSGGTPKFDLEINNDVQIGNTPWTWYDYVFRLPLPNGAGENRNYEGYKNDAAWALVQQLDNTPVEDTATMKSLCSKLQTIQLTDMPVIPLWYNGIWSQVNNSVWTNWPAEGNPSADNLPATWNGYWQMGGILMLTQIKSVKP